MALTGTEVIYVIPLQTNGQLGALFEQTTTGAIAGLASNFSNDSPTAVTATTGTTLTTTALLSGLINRSGPTAVFTDTTDTATNIVSGLGGVVGQSFYIDIKNTTPFLETLSGGTGVTFTGSNIIPANSLSEWLVVITSATAVVFNHVFTGPLTTNALEVSTSLSTVGAGTITGAGIAGALVVRSGAQSATAFTDTTDTAADIIAAMPNAHVAQSFEFIYQNTTNAPATITGGTGVTVSGITIAQANSSTRYLVTYTAAATITMYGFSQTPIATLGTFTATGATAVVVANTAVSPNSQIVPTLKTIGGTPAGQPFLSAITPGTGFSVKSVAGDTSVYNYSITW